MLHNDSITKDDKNLCGIVVKLVKGRAATVKFAAWKRRARSSVQHVRVPL